MPVTVVRLERHSLLGSVRLTLSGKHAETVKINRQSRVP